MPKSFIIEVTVPAGLMEGDKFQVEVALPEKVKKSRGMLAGVTVEEMTEEQLKRELINANSVLYKAKQRGASEAIINANQARVDAVKAERTKRGLDAAKPVVTATPIAATPVESVYDEDTAAEV